MFLISLILFKKLIIWWLAKKKKKTHIILFTELSVERNGGERGPNGYIYFAFISSCLALTLITKIPHHFLGTSSPSYAWEACEQVDVGICVPDVVVTEPSLIRADASDVAKAKV